MWQLIKNIFTIIENECAWDIPRAILNDRIG